MTYRMLWASSVLLALSLGFGHAEAGEIGDLITFQPNTPAKAEEVNRNFQTLRAAIEDNRTRLSALEPKSVDIHNYTYVFDPNRSGITKTYQGTRWTRDADGSVVTTPGTMEWTWQGLAQDGTAQGTWEQTWGEGTTYSMTFHYKYKEEDGRLYVTGYDLEAPPGQPVLSRTYDPPYAMWPGSPWPLARSWGAGFVVTETRGDTSTTTPEIITFTILGFQSVTVPAGTFEDCLVVTETKASGSRRITWYARQIGWVKQILILTEANNFKALYELTEYSFGQ